MNTEEGYHILLDVDTVLDTRLGTIALFNEDIALELSKNKDYINRLFDEFSHLIDHPEWSDEDFKETYEKRNSMTLAMSRPTPLLLTLRGYLLSLIADCASNPDKSIVEVKINLYPYHLTKEEKVDVMAAISAYCPEHTKITSTWMSPEDITPVYARSALTHWYTYDLDIWTRIHFGKELTEEKLLAMRAPRFTITCPKKFKSRNDFFGYIEMIKNVNDNKTIKDPFVENAFIMVDYVCLDYRDMFEFSIISDAADTDGKYAPKTA